MMSSDRNIRTLSLLTILLLFMISVAALHAGAQTESCVSASCHVAMGKDTFVHSPVKDGACSTCHQAVQEPEGKQTKHPGNLTITLSQQGADLCYMCHEAKNKKKTVHAPIQGGDCISCHNPHQSGHKAMLRDKMPELCFRCHPDSMLKQKVMHPPVAGGDCAMCHDNHQSDFPRRLVSEEPALCLQCHPAVETTIKSNKSVHPPVQQSCTPCHNPHGTANKAMLKAAIPDLCNNCHEPKNKKKVVHAPVMGGDCLTCHHQHAAANKGMLKQAMPQVCFSCHAEGMLQQKNMHPPVAAGDCSGCHDNHQSNFAGRILHEGNTLCFTCHPDKEDGLKNKKTVHKPVAQSCVQCHSPHGTSNKAMLISAVPALCSNCHPNEASMREKAIVKHAPMVDAKTCMNCHDPHFSDSVRLLPVQQMDLCLSCHDKQLNADRGTVMDMKSFLAENKNAHGPLKNKDCASCHNPHGSDYWRILLKYYPPEFYTSYADGKYGLCFSCHDKAAFLQRRAGNQTNFRNGDRNLHFVHVNKNEKGRTCRACHEVHADSGTQHHIKQEVLFKGWTMPMNYSPSAKGGSCSPGCHGEKTYSR